MADDALSLLSELPSEFKSNFAKLLAAALKSQYPVPLAGINPDLLTDDIQALLTGILPVAIPLDRTRPDFDSILVHLSAEVERTGTWADADVSATGQMLLRAIATDIDYGQFAIARALHEAFPETAQAESSVLLAARMLGNRLLRNVPARVTVTVNRGDPGSYLELPAYTAFALESETPFFCREPIRFLETDIEASVMLFQGRVKSASVNSTGQPYQTIEIGNETNTIAEEDIIVTVAGRKWTRVIDPIWHYASSSEVFYESTLQNGNVEILFGNGLNGATPPTGVPIIIQWVECVGAAANRADSNLRMELSRAESGLGTVVGTTSTPVTLGDDRKPVDFYRKFGSMRRAAQRRAVRRGDYRSHAVSYPGVKDARFRGQAELNPKKPSWQNTIGVTLLTDPPFTPAQWNQFVEYLTELGIYQCRFLRLEPDVIEYDLHAKIYCRPEANLADVETLLRQQILKATTPTYDSLGYSWYLSDLNDLIEGEGTIKDLIEFAELVTPTAPLLCGGAYEWVKLRNLTLEMKFTRRSSYDGRLDRVIPGLPRSTIT